MDRPPISGARPELDTAIDVAARAGGAVMEVYGRDFDVRIKDDDSPVTEADIVSNNIITSMLAGTPHPILSEEGHDDGTRLASRNVWIVDPLDGTADFVQRTGEFTIMVALVESGVPAIGVICCPAQGVLFAAQAGRGAYMHDGHGWRRIKVDAQRQLGQCVAVASRNHLSDRDVGLLDALGVGGMTRVGSSLKAAYVAQGRAHLYLTTTDRMKEWDSCASCCIITEAGGRMTDTLGRDISYNSDSVVHADGLVASNGTIHDHVIRTIREGLLP